MTCPIAIVGMACRYPDADTVEQLFVNSLAQRRAFRRIPESRLGAAYFDESGNSKDRAYARQAALIKGFEFDREWFRVSRASYDVTDQAHWLALTVAREAIEDIRFRKSRNHPDGAAVRVVVGNTLTGEFSRASLMRLRWPYVRAVVEQQLRDAVPGLDDVERERLLRNMEVSYKKPFAVPNEDFLAGGLANTIAGRICNHFDFKGGGYTIDGACSSSLLAVTDACSVLAAGDADMVLAGGVDLSLDPFELTGFSRSAALARTEMLVYDEHSEGFWPGEGCGFVALMRYRDALEQCEHVHAVIRGWGVSSDGRGGLTRPEAGGQMLALQRCYARAGYGIESVGYFEGHGTGTKVGDAIELTALITARGSSGHPIRPAVISSIKANIGHTKAAAGLAGLLRATKCTAEAILPPTTACRRPHALFAGNENNLAPSDRPRTWVSDGLTRRAGISAMGFGGINTHVTIEETSAPARTFVAVRDSGELARLQTYQDAELFLFAASRREDLAWTINHIADFAAACSRAELTDLAVELGRRATRGALTPWKAAAVATTPAELASKLESLKDALALVGEDGGVQIAIRDGVFVSGGGRRGKIGLMFSGQGAPVRAGGGIHESRFDQTRAIYEWAGLNLMPSRDDTDFAQPAIATASLAGLEMLRRVGIDGDVAVGHSLGELAALHWAGHFDAQNLLTIAKMRGRARAADPNTAGAMAAIAEGFENTAAAINGCGNVFIANLNSPRQTVVSGGHDEIERLVAKLRDDGVAATILRVRRAFHTPAMAGVAARFKGLLDGVSFYPGERMVVSTVTGEPLPAATDIPAYLCSQLASPVRFSTAASLAAKNADLLIEVGPGELLANLTREFCDTPAVSLDVGGDSLRPFLRAAAAAYVLDRAPKIGDLFKDRYAKRFDWDWRPKFLQNPCEVYPAEPDVAIEAEPGPDEGMVPEQLAESDAGRSTADHLRQIIADRTGLPVWTLEDSSRMLSELHLNSITVAEIIARLTASRGLPSPVDPTEYANASILEIATSIDRLKATGEAARSDRQTMPAGVAAWVRFFETVREPARPLVHRDDLAPGSWEGFGAIGLREETLLRRLNADAHGNGVIVWLSAEPDAKELSSLLAAAQRCGERARTSAGPLCFAVVQRGWGASGFAKSFFLEAKTVRTLVINLPPDTTRDPADWIADEIDAAKPAFSEIFIGALGQREEPRLRPVPPSPPDTRPLIGERDVVLVTGGGRGISAECGYQLARRTGCALLILGRSAPRDSDELTQNLNRLRGAGVRSSYQSVDVTDAMAVARAITAGTTELGAPVTGIVHGAGANIPRSIASLSADDIASTVSTKIDGFRNLLAAVDPDQLKLLVNFSSIIGRIGLPGEADYALANEWLSRETESFQSCHPHCRCRAVEWSVWSGTGMGQRLGRLDSLQEQGISAISIDDGIREFLRLAETPNLPTTIIVTGRFGNPGTIALDRPPARLFRFIDTVRVYYPGTELVAECHLAPETDLYLDDHVLNGERLLPAVLALEAMAQAAIALTRKDAATITPVFSDVVFRKAIVVPQRKDGNGLTLRLAVLADATGQISLAIRCSATEFQVNHVEARCVLVDDTDIKNAVPDPGYVPASSIQPFDPDRALYHNVLFQIGRFRRIEGYHLIEARRCGAQLSGSGGATWFSEDFPGQCLLGDPGSRDAALHAIQACIPHKIVIPVAVEEISGGRLDPSQAYRMFATEIADRGNELIYDLTIFDRDGRPVECWRKITLRVVGEPLSLRLNSPAIMAPFFERRIAEAMQQAELNVSITPLRSEQIIRTACVDSGHRPDGKPDPSIDGRFKSLAYDGCWKLAVESAIPVGCDLQTVRRNRAGEWVSMLSRDGLRLAEVVAGTAREPLEVAATRVWTVREAMKKAGLTADAPLILDPVSSTRWAIFNSGDSAIFSSLIDETANVPAICIAVALAPPDSELISYPTSQLLPYRLSGDSYRREGDVGTED